MAALAAADAAPAPAAGGTGAAGLCERLEELLTADKYFEAIRTLDESESESDRAVEATAVGEDGPTKVDGGAGAVIERVRRIKREIIEDLVATCTGSEGWTLKSSSRSVDKVYYKQEEDGTHSFRVEGFLNVPLFNLLALIYEFDLFPNWFPFVTTASELEEISWFRKVFLLGFKGVWPVAPREALLTGYGDVYKGDSVVIFARDAEDADASAPLPATRASRVRVALRKSGFHFIPLGEKRVLLRFLFNVDPKLLLPDWLVNIVVSKLCVVLLKFMRRNAREDNMAGSEYEMRINESGPVYQEIHRRLAGIDAKYENNYEYLSPHQLELQREFDAAQGAGTKEA